MTGVQLAQHTELTALPKLTIRPSPALIAATAFLALPSLDLEQAVERELAQNPALERAERAACNLCGRPLMAARCFSCERPRRISPPGAGPGVQRPPRGRRRAHAGRDAAPGDRPAA